MPGSRQPSQRASIALLPHVEGQQNPDLRNAEPVWEGKRSPREMLEAEVSRSQGWNVLSTWGEVSFLHLLSIHQHSLCKSLRTKKLIESLYCQDVEDCLSNNKLQISYCKEQTQYMLFIIVKK